MKLSFHGANQTVTGSCHLVEFAGCQILIDCGYFQGNRALSHLNREPFGFDPASIDFLLLTHAHLDHCGRIPLLVKQGFCGEIITTTASRDLAKLIMLDSAGLQEEEARYQMRRARRRGKKHNEPVTPLYTVFDALTSTDYFGRNAVYEQPLTLAPGITATFFNAGHILGSASILLDMNDSGGCQRILFSGDMGSPGHPLLRDPATPPHADIVVMETTYGDRAHKYLQPSVEELYAAINETLDAGGNVIIPTFALERAQELLYFFREGMATGKIPHNLPVFLDSPMAISATQIFRRHPDFFDDASLNIFNDGNDPFEFPGLHYCRESSDSMALNRISGGAIIIAGSGMCTGGRVVHHLKHNLWKQNSSVVFIGYAASGSLARRIIDGAKNVRIFGSEVTVRARIHTINGFSAHADCNELRAWHTKTANPEITFLVHGEPAAMQRFADNLPDTRVEIPQMHSVFDLKKEKWCEKGVNLKHAEQS